MHGLPPQCQCNTAARPIYHPLLSVQSREHFNACQPVMAYTKMCDQMCPKRVSRVYECMKVCDRGIVPRRRPGYSHKRQLHCGHPGSCYCRGAPEALLLLSFGNCKHHGQGARGLGRASGTQEAYEECPAHSLCVRACVLVETLPRFTAAGTHSTQRSTHEWVSCMTWYASAQHTPQPRTHQCVEVASRGVHR